MLVVEIRLGFEFFFKITVVERGKPRLRLGLGLGLGIDIGLGLGLRLVRVDFIYTVRFRVGYRVRLRNTEKFVYKVMFTIGLG